MTNEEINKRIHELLGLHFIKPLQQEHYCHDKCGCHVTSLDFTTSWEGFGILIEWWQKRDYRELENFLTFLWRREDGKHKELSDVLASLYAYPLVKLSPVMLAEATVEFFEENNGKT